MNSRFACRAPRTFAIFAQLLLVATCAQAHPGHGLLDHGAGHAITSPYHAGVLAAIGVGCWLAGRFVARRLVAQRLLKWTGASALVAAGALWTLSL